MNGRRFATIPVVAGIVLFAIALPLSAGTATVRLANYINFLGTTNTQTFTLQTQPFAGSPDCSSGGGAVSLFNAVDSVTGISLEVAPGDSVLLTVDPGSPQALSDQNGYFVGWGTDPADPDAFATFTFLPGDGRAVCVAGFEGANDYYARFYAGIQLLDECGNERETWAPGETVNIKVSGGLVFNPEQLRLLAAGGSVNECTFLPEPPAFTTVHVTSDPFVHPFTLPDSDADIPPACTGGGTQHITGNWRVVVYDSSCGCNRNQHNFTVANDAPPPPPCSIDCPDDVVVSNDQGACGADVSFDTPAGATCDHASGSFFPVGTTTVTCTAGALSCDFDVTVTDDEDPAIGAITASPSVLWPPNHRMVEVTVTAAATDNCGGVGCAIVSVTSNEPQNGTGDGDTAPDWELVDATHVRLRAERSGNGSGRSYTITVDCGGESGTVVVTVPKSRK
jgi:hypothetical protein